ncbi:MAG: xanthine dehydrogenase family protein subunit M [Candidatus Eremiobacteraeota bacterium]|nr:xanthine dehydrogenase family protein subunit M [Candidatus Eremiobacteraeota bacterium]MBV8356294.1 xanthine dehydrogenase family protein subunit M [Candidatus Eremiobacteraeota bacterium]
MIPAAFDYARAKDLEDVFALLAEHGDEAKILAGGHSLIPMMKLRLATPGMLIDITRISGLSEISATGDEIRIGALATHAAVAASDEVRRLAPALHDAANALGDPQVRNRGTLGGACAHADPAADYPAVLLTLDAQLTVASRKGTKKIGAADFFRGMFETALEPAAILTAVAFNAAPNSAYAKFPHPASHYAVVGVAANLDVQGSRIKAARIGVTGVGDVAFRATSVEAALRGVDVGDAEAIAAACVDAAAGSDARSDGFASARYRKAMADVFCARAVKAAAARR